MSLAKNIHIDKK